MAENVSVADWYSQEKVHGHPLGSQGVAFFSPFLNMIKYIIMFNAGIKKRGKNDRTSRTSMDYSAVHQCSQERL